MATPTPTAAYAVLAAPPTCHCCLTAGQWPSGSLPTHAEPGRDPAAMRRAISACQLLYSPHRFALCAYVGQRAQACEWIGTLAIAKTAATETYNQAIAQWMMPVTRFAPKLGIEGRTPQIGVAVTF